MKHAWKGYPVAWMLSCQYQCNIFWTLQDGSHKWRNGYTWWFCLGLVKLPTGYVCFCSGEPAWPEVPGLILCSSFNCTLLRWTWRTTLSAHAWLVVPLWWQPSHGYYGHLKEQSMFYERWGFTSCQPMKNSMLH